MDEKLPSVDCSSKPPVSWGLPLVFLKYAVHLVLLAALAFMLLAYLCAPGYPWRMLGPVLEALVAAITLILLARGRIGAALNTLVWGSWLIVGGVLFFYGGVRGTLVIAYPLIVMIGGWLLGTRSAIVITALSALVIVLLALVEASGKLPPAASTSALMYALIQIVCVCCAALLIVFLVRSYSRRLSEVKQLGDDLAIRTREAQRIAADLDMAQSVAHIGSWVYDFASDDFTLSDESCRIFGLPIGTHGTRSGYQAWVHPDDVARFEEAWAEALKGHAVVSEQRIQSGEETRWICQRARVEFDPQGRPLRCVGTSQDITALKLYEDELRIAATAFEAQEGMVITDAEQRILRINQSFTRVTGYSLDDVSGKTPRLLKSGRHDEAFYSAMWSAINDRGSWAGEIWNRRKSGEIYPEWLTITAVRNGFGVITHYVGTLADISQRKAAEDEIRHLAFYDPLTRLPNRRLLLDRLQLAQAASTRSGRQGALLFIDLDNFKALNDTLGHDKGDRLLQQVAHRLSACIREEDTASRFGGDEFVIMLGDLSIAPEESAAQAEIVGKKVLSALSAPYDLVEQPYCTTASIGITLFTDHQSTPFELLKQADLAMYEAKATGRNTICFYHPEMQRTLAAGNDTR